MATRKRKAPAAPVLPDSHLDALHQARFTVHSFRGVTEQVKPRECDNERHEWLPRLCLAVSEDKGNFKVIEWRTAPDNGYTEDGYFPSEGSKNGGYCSTIHEAIHWFKWRRDAAKGIL